MPNLMIPKLHTSAVSSPPVRPQPDLPALSRGSCRCTVPVAAAVGRGGARASGRHGHARGVPTGRPQPSDGRRHRTGHDRQGRPATLELQAKRTIAFTASDKSSRTWWRWLVGLRPNPSSRRHATSSRWRCAHVHQDRAAHPGCAEVGARVPGR